MTELSFESLATYWSAQTLATNIVVFLNLLGALLLGLLVGYERSYHGRAAGMRTYGLVCMASAALTVIAGFPAYWYGGHAGLVATADPTRIIQGMHAPIEGTSEPIGTRMLEMPVNTDRKSTRLNSSHTDISRMPSSA